MGRLIIIIISFAISIFSNAQDTALLHKKNASIQGSFTDFAVDNVGGVYLIINRQQIKKLNENGDSVAVYNDVKRFGKITSIDASNALKVLVYYKEASTVVILDRLLNVKNIIDLRRNNIQQVSIARLSYDNNIWVFDEVESKIKKLDENGKTVFESVDLRNVFSEAPSFQAMFDDNKSLYLYDTKLGWFVFDHYGGFSKRYAFLNWQDPQVVNGILTGRKDSSYVIAKNGDLDYKTIKAIMPLNGVIKIQFTPAHTYVLFPGKIEIYEAK